MKVKVFADGGSRGNPGVAGSGTVVYSGDGQKILKEIIYAVGESATNNVAEYHGLLRGLEAARELGASEVEFYMDSKLVVEQINGRWKIKHPDMQKLALEARALVNGFDQFSLEWIPRGKNKVADALSNDAMDAAAAGHPAGIVGKEDEAPKPVADDFQPGRGEVTRFILVRHGFTDMTAAKQYAGRADAKLNEQGLGQARALAQELARRVADGLENIDAIVTSPLQRCVATAQEIADAVPGNHTVVEYEDLQELDFGAWDGKTANEARTRDPELHDDWLTDNSLATPGGESVQALHRRVRGVRQQLQRDFAGKTVVVVSHVYPIKSFLRQGLDAGPVVFQRMFLQPASISTVEFHEAGATVTSFNECAHLG